jgi:opacity protein-like surface antigen
MKAAIILITLFLLPILAKSQDRILLKDGREINCRITSVDSININFTMLRNNRTIETMIKVSDVQFVSLTEELPALPESTEINIIPVKTQIEKRNSFYFSAGKCLPRNDFESDDIFSDNSGYAGKGTSINLRYKYLFTERIGLSVTGIYNSNEYKAEKVGQAISYFVSLPIGFNSTHYDTYGLIFAPSYLLPIDRLMIEGHAGLGFAKLKEPEVTYTASSGGFQGWVRKNSISASAVLYNVGGGLIFNVNKNWDLFADLEYLEGAFHFGENTIVGRTGETSEIQKRRQDVEIFTISIGIGLKF